MAGSLHKVITEIFFVPISYTENSHGRNLCSKSRFQTIEDLFSFAWGVFLEFYSAKIIGRHAERLN